MLKKRGRQLSWQSSWLLTNWSQVRILCDPPLNFIKMEQNIKKTFLSSVLFFLILSSWYNIRSVRNELAVENYGEGLLIPLLIVTTLTMICVNPIYSLVASRANYIKIVFYTYSFFILNFITVSYTHLTLPTT